MKKILFAALVTIALTSLAFAHGNTVHILGTVTAVSDSHHGEDHDWGHQND